VCLFNVDNIYNSSTSDFIGRNCAIFSNVVVNIVLWDNISLFIVFSMVNIDLNTVYVQ